METLKYVFLCGFQDPPNRWFVSKIFSPFQHNQPSLTLSHVLHVSLNTPMSSSADGKSGAIAEAFPEMRSRFHAGESLFLRCPFNFMPIALKFHSQFHMVAATATGATFD